MLRSPVIGKEPEKKHWLDYLAVFVSIFSIVLAGIALWHSSESIRLQNIASNYEPKIIVYSATVNLEGIRYQETSYGYFGTRGTFDISLIVISPHAGIINFSSFPPFKFTITENTNAFWTDKPLIDPNRLNLTDVHLSDGSLEPERYVPYLHSYVESGVHQVNFSLPISGGFCPNPEWIETEDGSQFGLVLGFIDTSMVFFDVQTQQGIPIAVPTTPAWVDFILR